MSGCPSGCGSQSCATGCARVEGVEPRFADVEQVLLSRSPVDTERLEWVLPIVTGDDDEVASRRTAALAQGLLRSLSGRELIDFARQISP